MVVLARVVIDSIAAAPQSRNLEKEEILRTW